MNITIAHKQQLLNFINSDADALSLDIDFNFLMQVVDKIESLGFIFKVYGNGVTFLKKGTFNTPIWNDEFRGVDKKGAVYNACIAFIEWYNNEKQ